MKTIALLLMITVCLPLEEAHKWVHKLRGSLVSMHDAWQYRGTIST